LQNKLQYYGKNKKMSKHICHDCKKELSFGEEFVRYEAAVEGKDAIKCKECYQASPVLKNFQPCDVYSRVVGFHTPTRRWNDAKAEEWKDRKTYVVNNSFAGCATC
jgi:anaerobic ribonucleoside-triphosphate reductase